jgi:hypothetical protein
MYQTEKGTWAREDLADHLPPLEERFWFCQECWQKVCSSARLANRILVAERIPSVAALNLRAEVFCSGCGEPVERDALVEVY